MRVLLLGGTRFLGRAVMEACVARGDRVTLFHRGRSAPETFEGVEHVIGDRDVSLDAVAGRAWDLVVDPSGYEVRAVRASARLRTARYVFVSSISVYAAPSRMDEEAPVREVEGAETATLAFDTYGALKAACERALAESLADRLLVVRAGLIVGPHDYDERFPWWLRRVARGGDVLAPGDPDALAQLVDVRDLARWMVASRAVGTVNATGRPTRMRELFDAMRAVVEPSARFVWAPDEVLARHGVAPYSEMPFWLPASLGAEPVPIARATADGLSFRPLAETVQATWAWLRTSWEREASVRRNRRLEVPAGISEERERRILADLQGM